MALVPTKPANARMAPTERSMPPATITSVMPSAMMLMTAVCRTTLERFVALRNGGEAIASATNSAIRLKNGSSRCSQWRLPMLFSRNAATAGASATAFSFAFIRGYRFLRSAHRVAQDLLLRGRARQLLHDAPAAHRQDP